VKNLNGAQFRLGNLLIVPLFLNSPDLKRAGNVVSYENLIKWAPFLKISPFYYEGGVSQGVLPGVFSYDVKCCKGDRGRAGILTRVTRPKYFPEKFLGPGKFF
jgi:hypothetical protein